MSICLCMIVKNEMNVIERCLNFVKPFINDYVIIDTGSTDQTLSIIQQSLCDIKGTLLIRPWISFSDNRQEALDIALEKSESQWILFIDADEILTVNNKEIFNVLSDDKSYFIKKCYGDIQYDVLALIKNTKNSDDYTWKGSVHECLLVNNNQQYEYLNKYDVCITVSNDESSRGNGLTSTEKYLKDAKLLEQDLSYNPNNTRTWFYLAQSYKDAGYYEESLRCYNKRIELCGWNEEVFMSLYNKAQLSVLLHESYDVCLNYYLSAFRYRPCRTEPLWSLALYARTLNNFSDAYIFSKAGIDIKIPNDTLFVNHSVYNWRLKDECSISAYYIGHYQESYDLISSLLQEKLYPKNEYNRLLKNREFARNKLL